MYRALHWGAYIHSPFFIRVDIIFFFYPRSAIAGYTWLPGYLRLRDGVRSIGKRYGLQVIHVILLRIISFKYQSDDKCMLDI